MSRFLTLCIVFLPALFYLSSCSAPKDLEYRQFKNLTVQRISMDTSSISLDVIYFNPNNYGMKLKMADLDVYIDSNYVGHLTQEYDISIPKKGEFSVPFQ